MICELLKVLTRLFQAVCDSQNRNTIGGHRKTVQIRIKNLSRWKKGGHGGVCGACAGYRW